MNVFLCLHLLQLVTCLKHRRGIVIISTERKLLISFALNSKSFEEKQQETMENIVFQFIHSKLRKGVIITVNFPVQAIGKKKPEKNQGFNRIRTHELRDTGCDALPTEL